MRHWSAGRAAGKRGESLQHKLLKTISARVLSAMGYVPKIEGKLEGGVVVDVLGTAGPKTIIVECETLSRCQGNLAQRFRCGLMSSSDLKRTLCIPKFTELHEIWVVDLDSGTVKRYLPKNDSEVS